MYGTVHRECLSVVCTVLFVRQSLEGAHFTIRTGHDPSKGLLNLVNATGKLVHRRSRLFDIDFGVMNYAGDGHQAVDA